MIRFDFAGEDRSCRLLPGDEAVVQNRASFTAAENDSHQEEDHAESRNNEVGQYGAKCLPLLRGVKQ